MNKLTRPTLPLMIEIERVALGADVSELMDAVEVDDYMSMVGAYQDSVEKLRNRIVDEYYLELTHEQLLIVDAILRTRLVLLVTEYLFNLLAHLTTSESSPLIHQLNEVLFLENDHSTPTRR